MMFVDFEEVNNEQFADPSSELSDMEKKNNQKDDDLIYGKIIEVLAQYIKDYKERAIKILEKHRVRTGTSDQDVTNAIVEMLYMGDKSFKDDLISDLKETVMIDVKDEKKESSFNKPLMSPEKKKVILIVIALVVIVVLFFVFKKKKKKN